MQNPDADEERHLAEEARRKAEEAQKRAERAAQKMEDAMKRAKLAQEQLKKAQAEAENGCLRAMVFEFYFSMSFSTFCGAVGEEAGCTGICTEAAAGAETGA